MSEIFEEIHNLPNHYIGSHGTVKNNDINLRPRIINGIKNVQLLGHNVPVHHLVLAYFSLVPDVSLINFDKIKFRDGNKMNCRFDNLSVKIDSKYKNIYFQNGTWKSYITVKGKRHFAFSGDNIEDVRYVTEKIYSAFFPGKELNPRMKKDSNRDVLEMYNMLARKSVQRIESKL